MQIQAILLHVFCLIIYRFSISLLIFSHLIYNLPHLKYIQPYFVHIHLSCLYCLFLFIFSFPIFTQSSNLYSLLCYLYPASFHMYSVISISLVICRHFLYMQSSYLYLGRFYGHAVVLFLFGAILAIWFRCYMFIVILLIFTLVFKCSASSYLLRINSFLEVSCWINYYQTNHLELPSSSQ